MAIIRPREVEFVSYPYEWAFSQLREAALLTLEIQARALRAGMWLRDASAYNVQFDRGRPVLIDSLSFAPADVTRPWPAYRQFCQHFLAPLALMARRDVRLGLLLRDFIDGLPLDLAAGLLPGRTRLNPGLLAHLHAHAGAERRALRAPIPTAASAAASSAAAAPRTPARGPMSAMRHEALLDSLRRTTESLRWEPAGLWTEYGLQTSYTERAAASKRGIVERMLTAAGGRTVWDVGANTGTYSDLAAGSGRMVLAFDQDAASVEHHWRSLTPDRRASILPLVMDLANPSPSLGWGLEERRSVLDRGPADVVMALALVHHLAIASNVPLPRIASVMGRAGRRLIVEFVPKEDPMTRQLLAARPDIFPTYTLDGFRDAFAAEFRVTEEVRVDDSLRTLFLMERR